MSEFGTGLRPIERSGIVEIVTQQLRDEIMNGTFGPGTQMGEAALAEKLSISRGPVREALQRLVQEGLLVAFHNRGVFVKTLEQKDVRDIMLARTAIEKTAATALLHDPRPEVISRLHSIVQGMREVAASGVWSRMVEWDMEFHRTVVDSRGSDRLSAIFRTLIIETRMSLNMLDDSYPVREEIPDEHQQLIDAILAGDLFNLYAVIDEHMDHSARIRETALARAAVERSAAHLRAEPSQTVDGREK